MISIGLAKVFILLGLASVHKAQLSCNLEEDVTSVALENMMWRNSAFKIEIWF